MAEACDRGNSWIRKLVVVFLKWKAILLILAVLCPRPGYDTSGLLLLDQSTTRHQSKKSWWQYERIVLNLLRWDALYFVKGAERSKVYEQEWAFSWAYSRLLRCVGQLLAGSSQAQTWHYVVAGFLISNVCHLLSSLVLFRLLARTMGRPYQYRLAFVAAVLHVLTPASLFMSAPYAEPIFSLLNFAGMLHYVNSQAGQGIHEDLYQLSSGLLFGLATLMRSNGLLSGLILVYDVAQYVPRAVSMRLTMQDMRRLIVTGLAGILVAIGYILPQYLAYNEYCDQPTGIGKPPWCSRKIPGIYTWVQSHYWNVGLFRYWTLPNLPLFLMAAPMLWILFQSSVTVLRSCAAPSLHGRSVHQGDTTDDPKNGLPHIYMVPELAIPQFVLTVAALTSFHVQIINRIASGYPTWYVLIARWIAEDQNGPYNPQSSNKGRWAVRIMVTYVITQGMLYANFLPPA